MTISEYISLLEDVYKEYGDISVVYTIDENGTSFNQVFYEPTVGEFSIETGAFITKEECFDINVNSVCLN